MNLIGVHTQLFRGTAAAVAQAVRRYGLNCVQLTPSFPDARLLEPGQITADRCRQLAEPFGQLGIVIAALSGGENLLDLDFDRRHPAIMRLHALIRHARYFQTKHIVLDLGRSVDTGPADTHAPQIWRELHYILVEALREARDHGATLLLKPDGRDLDTCREQIGRLTEEIAWPNLGFVMDPANYLLSRPMANLTDQLSRLCEELGPLAPLLHAKDLRLESESTSIPPAGRGRLDYETFFRLYQRHQPQAQVILEHVRPADIEEARDYLERCSEEKSVAN